VGSPQPLFGGPGNAWREVGPDQVEHGECQRSLAVGVGGALGDGQVGGVANDPSRTWWRRGRW